jgi:hypothetical protein
VAAISLQKSKEQSSTRPIATTPFQPLTAAW